MGNTLAHIGRKQIKIFSSNETGRVETLVNQFTAGFSAELIHDIKFSTSTLEGPGVVYAAMVVYSTLA